MRSINYKLIQAISVCRADFEEMAEPLFKKLEQLLQRLLQTARVKPEQIADVELIGGSSRVPRIKQIIAGDNNIINYCAKNI